MDTEETNKIDKVDKVDKKMPRWADRWFDAYAAEGTIQYACEKAEITRAAHYKQLKHNPLYRARLEESQKQVGDMLEDLAVQRVREGKPVLYQGEPVVVNGEFLKEYDTHLHHVLLKRFLPDLYRERASLEVSGSIDLVERMKAADQRLLTFPRNDPPATAAS